MNNRQFAGHFREKFLSMAPLIYIFYLFTCLFYLSVVAISCFTDLFDTVLPCCKCFDESIGCFNRWDCWDPVRRPFVPLPCDDDKAIILYCLLTRKNPPGNDCCVAKDITDLESLKQSDFDTNRLTIFITHGFMDDRCSKWWNELVNALLCFGDYNVFLIDWSSCNVFPYSQACSNAWLVAQKLSTVIKKLQESYNISLYNIHLIGHSVGAHIFGLVGKNFGGKIKRISAMDATAPYFQEMPPKCRLDSNDAVFVDVIHTNSSMNPYMSVGTAQSCGHADFYPNLSPIPLQPCCGIEERAIYLMSILDGNGSNWKDVAAWSGTCNHMMSITYYMNSIPCICDTSNVNCRNNNCTYLACTRTTVANGGQCIPMGFPSYKIDNEHDDYYISTQDDPKCALC